MGRLSRSRVKGLIATPANLYATSLCNRGRRHRFEGPTDDLKVCRRVYVCKHRRVVPGVAVGRATYHDIVPYVGRSTVVVLRFC